MRTTAIYTNEKYPELSLTTDQINGLLRLCHRSLEEHIQMELTDEQFIKIFDIWKKVSLNCDSHCKPRVFAHYLECMFSDYLDQSKKTGSRFIEQSARKVGEWLTNPIPKRIDYDYIVLHIPHAGRKITPLTSPEQIELIERDSKYVVDHYTDELFAGALFDSLAERVQPVIFEYNPLQCDVERQAGDKYECTNLRILDSREKYINQLGTHVIAQLYVHHQAALTKAIVRHSESLLIDCHSFSCFDKDTIPNAEKYRDIDISISWNSDDSRPDGFLVNLIYLFFMQKGYRIKFHEPYEGSQIVDIPCEWTHYKSLIIDVNRSLYMNEETMEKTEGFAKLQADLRELYNVILNTK